MNFILIHIYLAPSTRINKRATGSNIVVSGVAHSGYSWINYTITAGCNALKRNHLSNSVKMIKYQNFYLGK